MNRFLLAIVLSLGIQAGGLRVLDHWDNLDDSVERGYAGKSMWGWTQRRVPEKRIREYADFNRELGIDAAVLNNVNASPQILTPKRLERVAAIADILREYGIKVYLSVNFASPSALGELPTADPLDPAVILWWQEKVSDIYGMIPDFGGFLVKASSEGQPGPQDFGRTHADGANMLARALKPYGGIVMWRSFVYSPDSPDRAAQAYEEFVPLDGAFEDNVIIQVKNGPVDFQPREPASPLFWAMHKTALMPEFQITQEYLGQDRMLCYLAPMWKECLDTLMAYGYSPDSFAGVANTGRKGRKLSCGHPFAQANWYAFARLCADPSLSSAQIAREWLYRSFPKPRRVAQQEFEENFISPVTEMMLSSREACVDFMTPMGLHHLMAWQHHYGPDPGCDVPGAREDWLPRYYHRADTSGIGFDRTASGGSGSLKQYPEELRKIYEDPQSCPEEYLLWFHHLPWDYQMEDGRSLWEHICSHYDRGVRTVQGYIPLWDGVKPYVRDRRLWRRVRSLLEIQARDAAEWRDVCVSYFDSCRKGTDSSPKRNAPAS